MVLVKVKWTWTSLRSPKVRTVEPYIVAQPREAAP